MIDSDFVRDVAGAIEAYDWTRATWWAESTASGANVRPGPLSLNEARNVHAHVVAVVAGALARHDSDVDLDRFSQLCGADPGAAARAPATAAPAPAGNRYDELGSPLGQPSLPRCHVCRHVIDDGAGVHDGQVRRRGVAASGAGTGVWAWGPVPVHEGCRDHLRTPYDDILGDGYESRSDLTPSSWAAQMATAFPGATREPASGDLAPNRSASGQGPSHRHQLDGFHATGDPGDSGA